MEKVVRGLTRRALLTGLIILVVAVAFQALYIWRGVPTFYNPWPTEDTNGLLFATAGYMLMTLYIVALIGKKIPFTKEEIAVITAMTVISTMPWVANMIHVHIQMMFGGRQMAIEPKASPYYFDWIIPGPGAWDVYNEGGDIAGVFAAAGGRLLVWIWMCLVGMLFVFFMGLPLRRLIIDVQKLPYPYLQPVIITLDTTTATENGKPRILRFSDPLVRPFAIGVILGILAYLIFIPKSYPWGAEWPAPIGYEGAGYGHFWFFDFSKQLFPVIPWYLWQHNDWPPELIASLFFLPMDLMTTAAILWLLMALIGPPIAVALGLGKPWWEGATGQCVGSFCWGTPLPNMQIGTQWIPLGWISFGCFLFYGLVTVIFNPKPFINTIRGIWSKVEGEENEPLPYKLMWGLIAIFFLLFIVTLSTFGISIGQILLMTAVATLISWSNIKLIADFGTTLYWSSGWYGLSNNGTLYFGGRLGVTQPETPGAFYTVVYGDVFFFGYSACLPPAGMALTGYKVSDIYKARNRDILIGQIIALVITIILGYVFTLAITGALGFKNAASRPNWRSNYLAEAADLAKDLAKGAENAPYSNFNFYTAWAVGGVVIAILVALRTFIAWWPLHPAAFVLWGLFPGWLKMVNAFMLAFIIKLIVLKVGGTALYEKATKPAAGIAAGALIGRCILLLATVFGGPLAY
ncbi:MAG: DUF6784 domain-containing protein [Thermoproteota archaeon]